ncbi:hypothetical protein KYJ26_07130 [Bacillus sp. MCCB 382]|uniref:ABC-three component system middle component 1 n=1 Tax=Bacillus sp. MCCB 382 TaxID=2860197 RepID=UPI001C59916C|nr:hypothetical protein [Bacillus sp. MCCB 382]
MINLIKDFLVEELRAIELENDWINIDVVYASTQGIYGFVELENEVELTARWEECSYELATRVQAKLPNSIDNLRWDIYLIFLVNDITSPLQRKLIENDRRFFRKIVIPNNEVNLNRLPFMFDFIKQFQSKRLVIHQEKMFLNSLKSVLPESATRLLGESFFQNGEEIDSDGIYQLIKKAEGVFK